MFRVELTRDMHFSAWIVPDNFIPEVVLAKYFIQYYFHVMANMPVQMDVKASIFTKQFSKENGGFKEPLQISNRVLAPTYLYKPSAQ